MKSNLILVLVMSASIGMLYSCQKDSKLSPEIHDFEGDWIWTRSVGGIAGTTITPDSLGITQTVSIDETTYIGRTDNNIVDQYQYTYQTRIDHFGNEEKLIVLETGKEYYVFVVTDTLELRETYFDGFSHFYVRE